MSQENTTRYYEVLATGGATKSVLEYLLFIDGKTYHITDRNRTRWIHEVLYAGLDLERCITLHRQNPKDAFHARSVKTKTNQYETAKKVFLDRLPFWEKAPTMTDRDLQLCLYAYDKAITLFIKDRGTYDWNKISIKYDEFRDYCCYMVNILNQRKEENTQIGKGIPQNHKLYDKIINHIIPLYSSTRAFMV